MSFTDRVKNRAKHPTGGAVTGRIASHDPRKHESVNKVAGKVGHAKGVKGTSLEDAQNHQSAPLSTLRDPSAFGPPPKHVNAALPATGGIAPALPSSKPGAPALPSGSKPGMSVPKPIPYNPAGLGAGVPKQTLQLSEEEQRRKAEEEAKPKPPPVPYRADTTGLNTQGFAAPPVRRAEPEEEATSVSGLRSPPPKPQPRHPPPPQRQTLGQQPQPPPQRQILGQQPQPPPRLPARQNSNPTEFTPSPPPAYTAAAESDAQQHQPAAPTSMTQLSELQSRFSKLRTQQPDAPAQPQPAAAAAEPQAQGTTWAEKQAALRTASQLHQDPSSVSVSDMRAAASTTRDFHDRHGEQVASGWSKAKALDQQYDVRGKVGGFMQSQQQPAVGQAQPVAAAAAAKKAPPPPPPAKKRELQNVVPGGATGASSPPPLPMSSKPSW